MLWSKGCCYFAYILSFLPHVLRLENYFNDPVSSENSESSSEDEPGINDSSVGFIHHLKQYLHNLILQK